MGGLTMIDLDMGTYAAFVWPSWGVSAVVLGALALRSVLTARRRRVELNRLEAEAGTPSE